MSSVPEPSVLEPSVLEHREPAGAVHLRYLGWDAPILRSAAREILGRTPAGRVADLSRDLVALPGARAGRRIIEILVEEAEAAGRSLRPPRTTTVGGLPEHLYSPARPGPSSVVDAAAWRLAVGRLRPEEMAVVVPPTPGRDPEELRGSLAVTLRDLHAKVGISGLTFADVATRCSGGLLFSDEERWRVFARAQSEYRKILGAAGWGDRDESRRVAIREDRAAWDGRVWIVAAPELSPIVRAFLGVLRLAEIEILVGAPERLSSRFDPLGCVRPEAWAEERGELPESAIQVVTAPAEQADAMIEFLRRVASGRSAEEITIGVPDRDVVPYVVERLTEEGIPSRYAEGRPIEHSPAYRLLRVVTDYLDREDAEAFSDLLRHPWIDAAIERGSGHDAPPARAIQADLDRYRTLHLPVRLGRRGERLPSGGERTSDGPAPAVERARNAVIVLMASLDGVRPLSEWPEQIREFLGRVIATGPDAALEGEEADVVRRIAGLLQELEGLAGLPGVAAAMNERVRASAALARVLEELVGEKLPPEADEEAVELLGWLELALDDAPILVVTGANEPHLPESVTFDPFLPNTLQEALGLLGNGDRWARDLLLTQTIIRTRPEVLFVAGRQDSDGNPLHMSRLLLADEPMVTARRIRTFLEGTNDRRGVRGDGTGERLILPPDRIISSPAPIQRLSVTAFRMLLTDPYRFALEKILYLDGEDDRARELDPLSFGNLTHTVLQRWGESQRVDRGDAQSEGRGPEESDVDRIRARLDAILDEESALRFGSHPLPAVRIQVEQLRRRLRAFAKWQAAWWGEGWRIQGIERAFEGEGAALVVDGVPMAIGGKIDRVDQNVTTGEWCILDYKTSEVARSPEEMHRKGRGDGKKWVDLQLPLYRHLAHTLRDTEGRTLVPEKDLASLRVGYLPLSSALARIEPEWADWSAEEWGSAIEKAHDVVRFVRLNRFEYGEGDRLAPDDPLAGVMGGGVLLLADEDEGGTSDA